jgi:hypothetical protein
MYQESGQGGVASSAVALEKVKLPAIFLMVTAGLGALMAVITLVSHLFGTGLNLANMGDMGGNEKLVSMMSGGMGVGFSIVGLAMAGLVFFGASKMMKLEMYGLALTASIIAMIPCISPCCLLGLPIGIWALVVLLDPEVKAAFH